MKGKPETYILTIVGLVAVVGIIVLLLSNVQNVNSVGQATITGAQTYSRTCSDTDGGLTYATQGSVSGGIWAPTNKKYRGSKTDLCMATGRLVEYYCVNATHANATQVNCTRAVGSGYVCSSGACVLDSDGDGVSDSSDVCPGYNDKQDTDSDGTPDGCDTDDDGDGYSDADEATAGTDPLDKTSYPMPDLVFDSVTMSWKSGVAYITSNGTVPYSNASLNVTLGIKNDGTAAVGSTIRSKQKIMGTIMGTNWFVWYGGDAELQGLVPGATREVTNTAFSFGPLMFELYTNSSADVPYNYSIDYYSYASGSTWFGVNESNELNNNGTGSYTVSGSGITFIEVDCAVTSDCPSGCVCSGSSTIGGGDKYMCYEETSSGSSTYDITMPCS